MGRRVNTLGGNPGGGSSTTKTATTAFTETYFSSGQITQLTAVSAGYNVTLPAPGAFPKVSVAYWNDSAYTMTVTTPTGVFAGTGGSQVTVQSIAAGQTIQIVSDGTNYYLEWENLPAKLATTGGFLAQNGNGYATSWSSPFISVPSSSLTIGTYNKSNTSVSKSLGATSTNGSSLSYAITSGTTLLSGLSLSSSGVLTGSMAAAANASYTVDVTITDTVGTQRAVYTFYVSLLNQIPVFSTTSIGSASGLINSSFSTTITATAGTGTITYSLVSGSLPPGLSLNGTTGVISGNCSQSPGTQTYNFTIRATDGPYTTDQALSWAITTTIPAGTQLYTGAGGHSSFGGNSNSNGAVNNYTWTAPSGVNSVSAIVVGGGGGGYYGWAVCGGAGGALIWANGIPVTPGSGYTVRVGDGGCWSQSPGGCSVFCGDSTFMIAYGGCCGCGAGCAYIGGSQTGYCASYGNVAWSSTAGGGGGAAGYCCNNTYTYCNCGYGGGGGSSCSVHSSTYGSGGGGGVGIITQGTNGAGGSNGISGCGGSGGQNGGHGEPYSNGIGNGYGQGGCYGGGGGGGGTSHGGGWGGTGAVRIIWGSGRSYPNASS